MQPRSNSLFHFTRSIDFLTGILQTGFLPRYSLEDATLLDMDYVAYPMVCFCDIPMSRISEHTAFYGEYGIGMTKDWGRKNDLHPLLYAVPGGPLPKLTSKLFSLTSSSLPEDEKLDALISELKGHFFNIIPVTKPVTGKMIVGGTVVEKDFSQENEWRYVPEHASLLFKQNFDEKRDEKNAEVAAKVLKFAPTDVKYIFVKMDYEIPLIFDFIQNHLGIFPLNDIKIMISRIVSLETLSRDL